VKPDPLKLLAAAARQRPQLSHLFDREIARLLREQRRKLGLSYPEYAARSGVYKSHVVRVEIRNCRPQINDLYGAAKVLNPATEDGAWQMAVELQRQAAKNLLAATQPIEEAA